MTDNFASPLEDRLRAALSEVAEHVVVDPLPTVWSDEVGPRLKSRRVQMFAMAALAAALAVGVGFAVANAGSSTDAHRTPASIPPSTTPSTKPPTRAVALECPSKPTTVHHLRTAGRAATMVPGKPIALLACRYHGFNQAELSGSLAKSAPFDPARVATDLNAQPPIQPGRFNCPLDSGEHIDLLFAYADGSRLRISVRTSGCEFATNGVRTIRMDPLELARLQEVLGKDASVNNTTPTSAPRPTSPAPSTTPSTKPTTPAVALECPSRPPVVQPQQLAGTDTTLVPGTPTALLACRYHGFNQPEPIGTLAKSASFEPGPIATGLNSQPAIPSGVVSISPAGCRYASNGSRTVYADPATLDQLQAVLGKDAFP